MAFPSKLKKCVMAAHFIRVRIDECRKGIDVTKFSLG